MTDPERTHGEGDFALDDIDVALRIANSPGAQTVYGLMQEHPQVAHMLRVAVQYGARTRDGTGPITAAEHAEEHAQQQDSGFVHEEPESRTEDHDPHGRRRHPSGPLPRQPSNFRDPAGIPPIRDGTGGYRNTGPAYAEEEDNVLLDDSEAETAQYGAAGEDAEERTGYAGAGHGQGPAAARGRAGGGRLPVNDRTADLIERGRRPADANRSIKRRRAVLMAGSAAVIAIVAAVVAGRGHGSTEPPSQPETIATAVANPSWLHDPNVLTALHDELIAAAEDESIAVPVKNSATGKEVMYNAVRDNPQMVRAVATVMLYLGSDPYGIRGTQLAGVVPESKKVFTPLITQVNVNRKTEGQTEVITDPFNPPTSLLAAFVQANQIAAKETGGVPGRALPANFYNTLFTIYCQGLGNTGDSLRTEVGNLQAILDSWDNQTSAIYKNLLSIKDFRDRLKATITDQQKYRPGP